MKIKLLNFVFALLIFLISYLVVKRTYTKHQLSKLKNKSHKNNFRKIKLKNFISKINFLKTKDLFLKKQGYPLRLDSIRYYVFKITFALIFLTASIKNYDSIIFSIFISLIGYFFIDIYISMNKKTRDLEICGDLYDVVNSVSLQLSSHMSLKDSLKYQYENCKNKDFKKALIELSTSYELSEYNIDFATNALRDKFEILEIDMFCNALQEYNQTSSITEILDNLSSILEEKQIEKHKDDTRSKIIYITIGVIIALINIIFLIFYPLFISLGQGFNSIFR